MRRRNAQRALTLAPFAFVIAVGACAQRDDDNVGAPATLVDESAPTEARAALVAKSGSNVSGTVTFSDAGDEVLVVVDARGLSPGAHGIHVHEVGDCSAIDAESAGPHYAGHGTKHGALDDVMAHAGDFENIVANADGLANARIVLNDVSVAELVGRAVVVHAEEDDLRTQPSGSSGARIACGVVEAE